MHPISSIPGQFGPEAVAASVRSAPLHEKAIALQDIVAPWPEHPLQRMMLPLTGATQQQAASRHWIESQQDGPSPTYRKWSKLQGFASVLAFWLPYRLKYTVVIRPMP